jgi:ElaB/YqjD/DUF883 family membrane-anchored ribosome-binding protein
MTTAEQVASYTNSASAMANDALDKTAQVANKASDLSGQLAASLKGANVDQLSKAAKRQASALEAALVDTIRARPLQSLVVAGLAGLLIGAFRGR